MSKVIDLLARLINAVLAIINRKRSKDYADNPADAIANTDHQLRESDTSFTELAEQSKRDQAE